MDQRLQYEQVIAGKLESLSIPDMQDAIWSRIKAQLDIDMPTDDGGGDAGPQSPSGPGIIGWGLSVLLIAVLSVFYFTKKNELPVENNTPSAPAEQVVNPVEQANSPPAVENQNRFQNPNNRVTDFAPAGTITPADSFVLPETVMNPPAAKDSLQFLPPPVLTQLPPADTVKKKQRGVTGIGPDDYRIVPKKDSM